MTKGQIHTVCHRLHTIEHLVALNQKNGVKNLSYHWISLFFRLLLTNKFKVKTLISLFCQKHYPVKIILKIS